MHTDSALSSIPIGWEVVPLSEVVPQADYGISAALDDEEGVPVLRMNNLKGGQVDLTDLKYSSSAEAAKLLLKPMDILFNRTNSIEHVGRTAIWRGQAEGVSFASYLVRLVPDTKRLLPEYLNLWLNSKSTQLLIRNFATVGVHQVNINPTNLRKTPILLPKSLDEQQKIAAILSCIDRAIELTGALIANQQRLKTGLMQKLLTRGIDEHGKLRSEATHEFKDSFLGRIPKEWGVEALKNLLIGIDAGKSPDCLTRPAGAGEWGILKVSAINHNGFRLGENKAVASPKHINKSYEVKNGDFLISRSNTYELVGLTCLVRNPPAQLMLCDKTLRLNVNKTKLNAEFLAELSQMKFFRSQIEINATGSSGTMKNITQETIGQLLIPALDVKEQERIVTILGTLSNQIRLEIGKLNKLTRLKTGLMQNLLTGKIRVTSLLETQPRTDG